MFNRRNLCQIFKYIHDMDLQPQGFPLFAFIRSFIPHEGSYCKKTYYNIIAYAVIKITREYVRRASHLKARCEEKKSTL